MSDESDTMQGAPAPRVLDDLERGVDGPPAPVLAAPDLAARRPPRPVSAPGHRADVPVDVVANADGEPRPASVARHSADTSSIPVPVLPVAVDPSLPQPPERLTLDDGDLVRLVEDRFADTATIDLVAVVQAQLHARRVEAERFASWEAEIRRIDSDEALGEIESARLRFTGVIPVQRPLDVEPGLLGLATGGRPEARPASASDVAPAPSSEAGPTGSSAHDEPGPVLLGTAPTDVPVDLVSGDTAPVTVQHQTAEVAPVLDLTGRTDLPAATTGAAPEAPATTSPAADAPGTAPSRRADRPATSLATPRTLVLGASLLAALGVVTALVLAAVVPGTLVAALVATLALPAAAGLAALGGLLAVQAGPADAERVRTRGPLALVLGVALGTVLALGVLRTSVAALAWQGWALRLVGVELDTGVSVVVAVLLAAVVSFVATVLVVGFRSPTRD